MITAHGRSDNQHELSNKRGLEVAEGTCPLVRQAHDQLKKPCSRRLLCVVIGLVDHVEVCGLMQDLKTLARRLGLHGIIERRHPEQQSTNPAEVTLKDCASMRRPRFALLGMPDDWRFHVGLHMLNYLRWQTIAGEPQGSPEESPNTIRQHAA